MRDDSDKPGADESHDITAEANTDSKDVAEAVAVATGAGSPGESGPLQVPEKLPILPVRDDVAFPGTVMPLQISREKSKKVLDLALAGSRMVAVVAQRSPQTEDPKLDDLYRVGTACLILKMLKMADGSESIIVHGLRRVGIESVTEQPDYLEAVVHSHEDPQESNTELDALVHTIRTTADRIMKLSPNIPDEARQVLHGIETPGGLADFLAANLSLGLVHKQELLETFDVAERLRKVNHTVQAQLDIVELSDKIQKQVRSQVDTAQREYYLREQMKAIKQELGDEAGGDTLDKLRERITAANLPEAVRKEAVSEVDRMEHIPVTSPEYGLALDYVDWLVELPWSVETEDSLDIHRAEQILDEDHYGLEKVKKRIIEFLAVRKLKGDTRGPILCFAGPPGVGKTSLGQSIARAMGRNFIRVSLGGIRDEATIRGHRRTYIGSMPGRIIREIRRAGSNNPLFMLDEVDKIGQDVRGDPMSALLEVLDPAQNNTFVDHYIGLAFDLSKVLFIGTANYMSAIEPALRDRMEIIELNGYTTQEKLKIARQFLFPRQRAENGLKADQIELDEDILKRIIADYTREAGVRSLERRIGAVCRARAASVVRGEDRAPRVEVDEIKQVLGPRRYESEVAATEPMPGVATALAFTPVGGEILFVEATKMPGSGQLHLTGQLGDVMRESAWAASSIIRSRLGSMGVPRNRYHAYDYHVHVPAGAIPKDGPSAGIAILAALMSALADHPMDPTIGMTGEITLSGRVLPIGGVREKVTAAHRAGIKTVLLPARNQGDVEEVPEDIRGQINFVFVNTIDDVLDTVFPATPKRQKKTARQSRSKKKKKKNKKEKSTKRSSRKGKGGARDRKRKSTRAKTPSSRTSKKGAAARGRVSRLTRRK